MIIDAIWAGVAASETVGAHMRSLCRKLRAASAGVEVESHYGCGYRLVVIGDRLGETSYAQRKLVRVAVQPV